MSEDRRVHTLTCRLHGVVVRYNGTLQTNTWTRCGVPIPGTFDVCNEPLRHSVSQPTEPYTAVCPHCGVDFVEVSPTVAHQRWTDHIMTVHPKADQIHGGRF